MDFEELSDDIEQLSIGDEVLSIHQTRKTLIFALHVHLNQFELHLDAIMNKYKALSLLFLLSTYVAIGFLFSSEAKSSEINIFISVSSVCLFGIIGITSLWYIDLQTLHKFWGAFFVEGIKMEKKYKFLLKIGDLSLALDTIGSRIRGHEGSYIFANLLLCVSTGIALVLSTQNNALKLINCLIVVAFSFFMVKFMRKAGEKLQMAIESLLHNK